jgi:hypothetical protein
MDFTDHLARSSVCPQESIYLGDLVQDVECLLAETWRFRAEASE